MTITNVPCTMCGTTGYTRTRQHILKKEWRTRYPWLNSHASDHRSLTDNGDYVGHVRNVDFLNQQVGPFCPPCNNVFMLGIEDAASPALERLFTTKSLEIRAHEIGPLRRWAYQTMLVRSEVDRSTGHNAPSEWFRDFHASSGAVPPQASFLVARVEPHEARHSNFFRQVQVESEIVTTIDSALLLGGLFIVSGMHSPASAEVTATLRWQWQFMTTYFPGQIADLSGREEIRLVTPLSLEATAYVRAPTAGVWE